MGRGGWRGAPLRTGRRSDLARCRRSGLTSPATTSGRRFWHAPRWYGRRGSGRSSLTRRVTSSASCPQARRQDRWGCRTLDVDRGLEHRSESGYVKGVRMVESVEQLEVESVVLSERLTAPTEGECLLCFVNRMLTSHGCDTTLRWAKRWRGLRAPRATALERTLGAHGGYCDCEIFMNGWTASPAITSADPETDDEIWPDPMPNCLGVRPRSTRSCSLWVVMSRRGGPW